MKVIKASIEIEASIVQVWRILSETNTIIYWQKHTDIDQRRIRSGRKIKARFKAPNGPRLRVTQFNSTVQLSFLISNFLFGVYDRLFIIRMQAKEHQKSFIQLDLKISGFLLWFLHDKLIIDNQVLVDQLLSLLKKEAEK